MGAGELCKGILTVTLVLLMSLFSRCYLWVRVSYVRVF